MADGAFEGNDCPKCYGGPLELGEDRWGNGDYICPTCGRVFDEDDLFTWLDTGELPEE